MSAYDTTSSMSAGDSPWNTPWSETELESVYACPVCGCVDRKILQEDLIDNVFFIAPGKWTLYRCNRCRSAYLDPRPTQASIGKAYAAYYTHAVGIAETEFAQLGQFRRLRRMLVNGYLNKRYGTQRSPAAALGVLFA
ncbi:hypothetical protein, partial [Methylocystis suflitae]|uniref:hypothetical protein n=1 Tax=Methylocystis suflitae TaxID=2951405 RepID=UPI00210CDE53